MLRPLQLICLSLHFLDLPPLRMDLGARVNQGDHGENRARDSSNNARINIHLCLLLMLLIVLVIETGIKPPTLRPLNIGKLFVIFRPGARITLATRCSIRPTCLNILW